MVAGVGNDPTNGLVYEAALAPAYPQQQKLGPSPAIRTQHLRFIRATSSLADPAEMGPMETFEVPPCALQVRRSPT